MQSIATDYDGPNLFGVSGDRGTEAGTGFSLRGRTVPFISEIKVEATKVADNNLMKTT
jgi:hypothetical protein